MRRRYEFRRLRAAFLAVFVTTALIIAALGALYALLMSTGAMTAFSYSFVSLPSSVRGFFGILSALDLSDPLGYFCRTMYLPTLISSVMWLAQGARALNAEQAGGLAELLFTQPGTRSGLFWKRWAGGVLIIVLNLLLLAALLTGVFLLGGMRDLSALSLIWIVFGRMLVVHLFCWDLGLLFSAIFPSPTRAGWLAACVLLVLTLTTLIPASTGALSAAWYWSFLHYSIPEFALHLGPWFTWQQILSFSLATLLTLIPAWLMLRARQIDCDI